MEPRFNEEYAHRQYKLNCQLIEEIKRLQSICKEAAQLYDRLALSSLEHAAKYGPDVEPPTEKDCLAIRQKLEDAQRLDKCINCGKQLTVDDTFDTCMECLIYLEELQEDQFKEQHRDRVTKDMATDAGDPDLEGQLI